MNRSQHTKTDIHFQETSEEKTSKTADSPSGKILQTALEYARNGFCVLPLAPGEKVPLRGTNGVNEATTDPDTIREWFQEYPEANLGIATGEPSGVFVLDIDGERGQKSLQTMIDRKAESPPEIATPTNQTPNGKHLIFKLPDFDVPNSVGLRKNLDVRGEGGYIVAPPSVHPSGETYNWNRYLDIHTEPIDAPSWLLDEIKPSQSNETTTEWIDTTELNEHEGDVHPALVATRRAGKPLEELEPGERNEQIFRAKLTWINLEMEPEIFDKWFLNEVLPELNQGPGHDGEKFTKKEAVRTLRNAEKDEYKSEIPDELQAYFKSDTEPSYRKGPDDWTTVELCRILMAFFDRYGTLELDSRDFENGGITEGLLESVQKWIDRNWPKREPVPRSTLQNALDQLRKSGHLEIDQRTHYERKNGQIVDRYTTGTIKKSSPSIAVRDESKPTDKPCCFNNGFNGDPNSSGLSGEDSKGPEVEKSENYDSKRQMTAEKIPTKEKQIAKLKAKYPDHFNGKEGG